MQYGPYFIIHEESLQYQHRYWPIADNTWCKYQQDMLQGSNKYNKSHCLPYIFQGELEPIFQKLSSAELLSTCQKGLTQNANESINGVVWSRCPKRVFCGRQRFTISVCDAIIQFNEGAKGRKRLFNKLNLEISFNAFTGLQKQDKVRLQQAAVKITDKYKQRRQALRLLRKGLSKTATKGKAYVPGAFTNKSVPDTNFTSEQEKIVKVTFVDDDDVPFVCYEN